MNKRKAIKNIETVANIWMSILLPLLSVGLCFLCAKSINVLGIKTTIIISVAIIVLVLICAIIVERIATSVCAERVSTSISSAAQTAKEYTFDNMGVAGINGVFSETEIAAKEKSRNYSEIWLVSFDLQSEVYGGAYENTVIENVRKGTKYKYFIPDNPANREKIRVLFSACNYSENIEAYILPQSFFFLVSEVDFAIYEPYYLPQHTNEEKCGYMGLNINGLDGRYEVAMSPELIFAIQSRLAECITEDSKISVRR